MREEWKYCELAKHIKLIDYRGRTPIKTQEGIKLITAKNVKLGYLQNHPEEFIAEDNYEEWMRRGIPQYGDVIFTTEAPLANVAQLLTHDKVAFAQRTIVMQPEPEVLDKTFLKYLLLSPDTRSKIFAKGTGATVTGIKSSLLKKIPIPIPPLKEQKQIVIILDQAFEAIEQAKANIEKNIANAKELIESYKKEIFEIYSTGNFVEFKSIVKLTRGHNPPKKNFIYEPKEGYIRFYQIRDGWSDDYKVYVPDNSKLHKVKEDEMLMVAYRHIGKVFRGVNGAFNVALCKITNSNKNILNDDYLFELIPSPYIKGELLKISERSLIPSMSVKELEKLKVPLPTMEKQLEIIELLNSINNYTGGISNKYQTKLNSLEELRKSILQKAFSGELTQTREDILAPEHKHALLIALSYSRHQNAKTENTFGHTKSEKMIHLFENYAGIELNRNPIKDAAGPNDFNKVINVVEPLAKEEGYFSVTNEGLRYTYGFAPNFFKGIKKLESQFTALEKKRVEDIISLFLEENTEQSELYATVYAAWNNLLLNNASITDEAIVYEARENWHEKKMKIERSKFFDTINKLKAHNIIPEGKGKLVEKKTLF